MQPANALFLALKELVVRVFLRSAGTSSRQHPLPPSRSLLQGNPYGTNVRMD
jgi:hypothetical protein